jgi:diacylglycerol O-acyltransferase / wax synthase
MSTTRLSALDSAFLAVETPTAHMHVGWAAVFDPPADRAAPSFEELRDHIRSRLGRAPRYRQLIRRVPLGLNSPVWTDDPAFDADRHVVPAASDRLSEIVEKSTSEPLPRDRPLWQMSIAPRLDDGRIGLVGKAHHCMVDGIAAVELGSLLLDSHPEPPPTELDEWNPRPLPVPARLVAEGMLDLARRPLELAGVAARIANSPGRLAEIADRAGQAVRAVIGTARPATPVEPLNIPNSPGRHLAQVSRPLDELRGIKTAFGTKLNDVILAASSGAMRRLLSRQGETPIALKAMVPVNVRDHGDAGELGNRISFIFVNLPCDEPDPARRLQRVHAETSQRKSAGEPQGADDVVRSVSLIPTPLQRPVSRFLASPRAFNLTVSNIPGPRERLYMRGCELKEAYPIVPLADRHALAIGVTNVGESLCFGLYSDRKSLPEADLLARDLHESIDELIAASTRREAAHIA